MTRQSPTGQRREGFIAAYFRAFAESPLPRFGGEGQGEGAFASSSLLPRLGGEGGPGAPGSDERRS